LPNSLAPHAWLDEKGIEFCVSVIPQQNDREPDWHTASFRDMDLPGFQLMYWDLDSLWMGRDCVAVPGICKRSAPL